MPSAEKLSTVVVAPATRTSCRPSRGWRSWGSKGGGQWPLPRASAMPWRHHSRWAHHS